MKKLTSLTITLGAMLMLGACGAKEETTVFQQELPSELQGKNLGSSDLKITHKGVKIIKVVSESEIPLTFGLGADELADAKKEIEDNAELSQEEKNNLLAEMEKTTNADPEAQAVEMAKNHDDMYANMSSKGIAVKTKKDKDFYHVTVTVDFVKVDKDKLAQVALPIDFSAVKDYQGVMKELKKVQFKEKK